MSQNSVDAQAAVDELKASGCDAVVHWGFSLGLIGFPQAFAAAGWDPPRYMGTAFEVGYTNERLLPEFAGWIGLEQYEETNLLGQAFVDRARQFTGDGFKTVLRGRFEPRFPRTSRAVSGAQRRRGPFGSEPPSVGRRNGLGHQRRGQVVHLRSSLRPPFFARPPRLEPLIATKRPPWKGPGPRRPVFGVDRMTPVVQYFR